MSDLNVSLILKLVDRLTAPTRKATGAIADQTAKITQEASAAGRAAEATGRLGQASSQAARQGELFERAEMSAARAADRVGSASSRAAGRVRAIRQAQVDAGRAGQAWNRQLEETEERMARLGMATFAFDSVGRTGRRLVGALRQPVQVTRDYEQRLEEFGIVAGVHGQKLDWIGDTALSTGRDVHRGAEEMLGGLELMVGRGLDLEKSVAALPAVGKTATATSAEVNDIAGAGFSLIDNLEVAPARLQSAFDAMNQAGKSGGFELRNMAAWFPEITANAKALGLEGVPAVAELSAALQVAMKGAGSPDKAANNMANFLSKLASPESVRRFEDMGIDLEAEMQDALDRGVSPLEHILEVIQEATGGDQFKLGQLFGDMQVLSFLRPMMENMETFKQIRDEAMAAGGSVDSDFARMAAKDAAATADYQNAVFGLQQQIGEGLLPVTTAAKRSLAGMLTGMTDFAERASWFSKTLSIAAGVGGGFMMALGGVGNVAISLVATYHAFQLIAGSKFITMVGTGLRLVALQAWATGRAMLVGAVRGTMAMARSLGMLALRALPMAITGFRILTVTMMANPIIAIVSAIAIAATLIIMNWSKVKAFFGRIWDAIQPRWEAFAGFVGRLFGRLPEPVQGAIRMIGRILSFSPLGLVRAGWEPLVTFFRDLFSRVFAFAKNALDGIIDRLAAPFRLARNIGARLAGAGAAAGAGMALAGAAAAAPEVDALRETGVATSPAGRAGGGPVTERVVERVVERGSITVQTQPGQDNDAIARKLADELRREQRKDLHDG